MPDCFAVRYAVTAGASPAPALNAPAVAMRIVGVLTHLSGVNPSAAATNARRPAPGRPRDAVRLAVMVAAGRVHLNR